MTNLDGSKGFYVKGGIKSAQPSDKIEIPILFQRRMKSADHMHFGDSQAKRIAHHADDFIDRVFKRVRITFLRGESAKLAGENANIRVIDVTIVDVSCVVAVFSFAHDVGHDAKRVEIVRIVKTQSV